MFLVHEIFDSIQGEGIRTGLPTVFIRLAGCNLECLWCDTAFARSEIGTKRMSIKEILVAVRGYGIENVCLTGGEPFCHEALPDLVSEMLSEGYNVDLETNGSFDVSGLIGSCPGVFLSMDVKTPSSGMADSFDLSNLDSLRSSDQLKFVISGKEDLEFALSFILRNRPLCGIIFTPCDNLGGDEIVKTLREKISGASLLGDGMGKDALSRIRVMLQTHKMIWGNVRGV